MLRNLISTSVKFGDCNSGKEPAVLVQLAKQNQDDAKHT